jgi:hypothetical protein
MQSKQEPAKDGMEFAIDAMVIMQSLSKSLKMPSVKPVLH